MQIYRNVDPKAQEWLILPVDADNFRIVPRSNMSLSLTSCGSANGTANGRTSTSAGNVFVSTYTGADNQLWEIYKAGGSQVKNEFGGVIYTGTYYISNRLSGKLIKNAANSLTLRTGTSDIAPFSERWEITQTGSDQYIIQPTNRSDLFLCGDVSTKTVKLNGSPTHYWDAEMIQGAGMCLFVQSGSTKYVIAESNGSLVLQARSTQTGTAASARQAWKFMNVDTYRELTGVTFSNRSVECGKTVSAYISSKTGVNNSTPTMCTISDFTYSGGSGFVSCDALTGRFTGLKNGTVTITATHKVHTNVKDTFTITVTGEPEPEPEPEPEVPLFNPNPSNIPTNEVDKNVTLKDGRYFRIPHDDLKGFGQLDAKQLREMLSSKGLDGEVEIFSNSCQTISPNIGSGYAVNKIGYMEYTRNANHRPFVELLRRTKVAVIFTHANSKALKLDTKSDFDSSALYLTSEDLKFLPDDYFNYCQLILLICCGDSEQTADNTTNIDSVMQMLSDKGAQNVIGFKHEVFAKYATLFEYNFFNYLNADPDIPGLLLNDLADLPSGDLEKENKEYTISAAFDKAVRFVNEQVGSGIIGNATLISNGDIAIRPYEMDLTD